MPNTIGARNRGSSGAGAARFDARIRPSSRDLARHHLDATRSRDLHPEVLARDLLHAHRHRPRRLLELQLAELGFVRARARRLALQLDEELARLMPRRDERERAER